MAAERYTLPQFHHMILLYIFFSKHIYLFILKMHIRSVWSHFLCCFAHFIQITKHNRTVEWTTAAAVFFEHISSSFSFCFLLFAFIVFSLFLFFKWISSLIRRVCQLCEHFAVCCMRYAICDMCRVVYLLKPIPTTQCQLPDVPLSTVCRLFSRDFIHLFNINLKMH